MDIALLANQILFFEDMNDSTSPIIKKKWKTLHSVFQKYLKNSVTKNSENQDLIKHQILITTRKSLLQEFSLTKMFVYQN